MKYEFEKWGDKSVREPAMFKGTIKTESEDFNDRGESSMHFSNAKSLQNSVPLG